MENYKKIELFKSLSDSEIIKLMANILFQKKKYKKNDIIVYSGTNCNSLKVVLSGSAYTQMNNMGDKVIKIADIGTGQVIAISFIFGNNNIVPVDVIANEDCEIIIFQKEAIHKMITLNDKILDAFLKALSNQTQFLTQKIKFLNFNTIKEKLMYFLKEKSSLQKSDIITIHSTQQQIAELFGVTRPSLARALKALELEGKIKHLSAKTIEILY